MLRTPSATLLRFLRTAAAGAACKLRAQQQFKVLTLTSRSLKSLIPLDQCFSKCGLWTGYRSVSHLLLCRVLLALSSSSFLVSRGLPHDLDVCRALQEALRRSKQEDQPNLYQVCSPFATGPRQDVGTIYELRTYDIKPAKTKEFLELVNKNISVRMAHSEIIGFWMAELGAMNKAFHIWKYDNFAHRTAVRKAILHDTEWQEKLSAIVQLLYKQDMEIAYLVPWCQLGIPPKQGVYELVTYQLKPGGPALWGKSFKTAIEAYMSKDYTKLIGVFHTEYGELNTVHVLWWYENPDSRAAGRHDAHEDARVVAAVRESVQFLESQRNMLLIPAPFSPLK